MFRRKTNWYFFCLLLFKVWWSLGSVLRTTPSLSCAKKILEHDFNTSVYTHSHGSLMFFVRPYCLKMTWVELGEEGRTIFVGHTKKCILVTQINWSFFLLQTLLFYENTELLVAVAKSDVLWVWLIHLWLCASLIDKAHQQSILMNTLVMKFTNPTRFILMI